MDSIKFQTSFFSRHGVFLYEKAIHVEDIIHKREQSITDLESISAEITRLIYVFSLREKVAKADKSFISFSAIEIKGKRKHNKYKNINEIIVLPSQIKKQTNKCDLFIR